MTQPPGLEPIQAGVANVTPNHMTATGDEKNERGTHAAQGGVGLLPRHNRRVRRLDATLNRGGGHLRVRLERGDGGLDRESRRNRAPTMTAETVGEHPAMTTAYS